MSEAVKTQEPGSTQPVPDPKTAAVEVDKSIPEPVVAQPTPASAPSAESHTESHVEAHTEAPANEKHKDPEKTEDIARSLLKGFQLRLAGVFPKKADKTSETKEDSSELKEETKEEEKEVKERRSASRKRNSFFGGLGLGKKEEKVEVEEVVAAETVKDVSTEATQPTETPSEKPVTSETTTSSEPPHEKPVPVKRTSIFGNLKYQFARKEKPDPVATIAKETENVTAAAPVIPEVGKNDTPVVEATTTTTTQGIDKAPEARVSVENKIEKISKDRRKSTLPFSLGLGKKEKLALSDDETHEKPLSPFARIRATVKSKTSPKHTPEKKEETNVSTETKNEDFTSQPTVSEPEPAVTTASPTVAASA